MRPTAKQVQPVDRLRQRGDAPLDSAAPELSFDEWVAARGPALVRFAHLLTGNLGDAQDAVQDVLISVDPKWPRLQAAGTEEAYVRRAIVNRNISIWRSFRRQETPAAYVHGLAAERAGAWSPTTVEDASGALADAELAWRLCQQLSRVQRAAVVLRYYEDQSFGEIAQVLGCTESTARSHVRRALAVLREHLEETAEHDD